MADSRVNKPKVVTGSYMCKYLVSNVTPKTAEKMEEIEVSLILFPVNPTDMQIMNFRRLVM